MKKNYFKNVAKFATIILLLVSQFGFSQSDYLPAVPSDGGTSGNARAPHGRFRYQRGVYLIKATEMTAAGYVNGDVINAIAFNYLVAQNTTTDGTMTIYLQNSADATNTKGLNWATAITGMTTVSNSAVTIPNTIGNVFFPFSGGSAFTYTGGGVYVAFDYQNAANTLPTSFVTVDCNSTGLASGFSGGQSDTAAQTTLAASSFRPATFLGKLVTCDRPNSVTDVIAQKTTTSATLTWTGGNNTTLEYGLYGFTQGTGTVVTNVTSPYTISGLPPGTVYDVYLKNNCGTVATPSFSATTPVTVFYTTFLAANAPYNTGFEQERLPFIGWSTPNPSPVAGDWAIGNYGAGALVQEGVASVVSVTPTTAANNWMFSRGINLTAGSPASITMYMRNFQGTGVTANSNYLVTAGTSATIAAQTISLGGETAMSNATFVLKTFSFTPTTTGIYYFGVKNQTAAVATGTHAVIVDNFSVGQTLGTNQFLDSKFSVYPNPVKDIVTITNISDSEIEFISIFDFNGKLVQLEKGNSTQLNLGNLTKGVYFMNFKSNLGTIVKKIIKE
jgi:hypothetical protein